MNPTRLLQIMRNMTKSNMSQLIISDPASIFYLTGEWFQPGERLLALYLRSDGNHKLFINELFAVNKDLGVKIVYYNDTQDSIALLSQFINKDSRIGVDKNWYARFLLSLMEQRKDCEFINGSSLVDPFRMRKDEQEIDTMRSASKLNDQAMHKLIHTISQGYSEKNLAQLLLPIYEEIGANGFSFAPIIAFGANAADPHHEPDATLLKPGDCIVMDIGCKKDSYCSDMTRTVFYQHVSDHARKVYSIVLEANKRAIAAVRPGVKFSEIDAAARNCIEKAGYGQGFIHRTGHSIGLDVHECGDVSAANHDSVLPGNIFSIEPCIVIPGELGIRVEDLVLVTDNGCEVLNKYNKELTIIG